LSDSGSVGVVTVGVVTVGVVTVATGVVTSGVVTVAVGVVTAGTVVVTAGTVVPTVGVVTSPTVVDGTVGVVVPAGRRDEVSRWVASWPEVEDAAQGGDDARLVVLTGLDTKGLEFDGIVVVQPDQIEQESVTGRATLYVVLTRATQRLVTVSESTGL
jgi:hypothetical protein